MIATHGPTLRLPDREGVVHSFVLRRVENLGHAIWTSHGIALRGPWWKCAFGDAYWCPGHLSATPLDSSVSPLELLSHALAAEGITADDILERSPWRHTR